MEDGDGNDWHGTAHKAISQPQYFTDMDSKAQQLSDI